MKPIQVRDAGKRAGKRQYTVHVDGEAAKRFGSRRPRNGNVVVVVREQPTEFDKPRRVSIVADQEASPVSWEEAQTLVHQIGSYLLDLGNFVQTYTDAPDGFWERRRRT